VRLATDVTAAPYFVRDSTHAFADRAGLAQITWQAAA
jgi:hypothetical protein